MQGSESAWRSFRKRTFTISLVVVILAASALAVLYQFEPSSLVAERAKESGKISPQLFAVLQTFLTTLLSIGGISLLFELLLRESYGRDLLRFLNLRTALVTSGLQDVSLEPVDWGKVFDGTAKINVLARDPNAWLAPYFVHLLQAAVQHSVDITIGLPDSDGPNFEAIADSVSLRKGELHQHIDLAVSSIENQWKANETRLQKGSSIRIVAYERIPLYELVAADDRTVCVLTGPMNHQVGASTLAMSFEQERTQRISDWLEKNVAGLASCNEIWVRQV